LIAPKEHQKIFLVSRRLKQRHSARELETIGHHDVQQSQGASGNDAA